MPCRGWRARLQFPQPQSPGTGARFYYAHPLMPALSVVIPTHDTRELTLACVVSVEAAVEAAAAALSDTEILVVDDGSGDGTAEALAARHPRIAVMRLSPAAGFTRAANLGMARSRGEVLLLLNSDTEVAPGALARLRDAFAREPRLGAAGALLHYPDGRAQWSGGGEPGLLWLFALASGLPPLLARLPGYRRAKPAGAPAGRVAWVAGAALAVRRRA